MSVPSRSDAAGLQSAAAAARWICMLSFDYAMELDLEGGEAREHSFTLRCLPQETAAQHICDYAVTIKPLTQLSYGTDAFGTRYCYGVIHEQHEKFRVEVSGTAERFPWQHETAGEAAQMLYRQQTAVTRPGPAIRKLWESLDSHCPAAIRDMVYRSMQYTPGATSSSTSAEEAAARREGVCQDYAHIMLSLCRMSGIPCRYTAGLLMGEGASHAWVEICDQGQWWEMDPTNPDVPVGERLIFSHGRDAKDCEINRGVYLGPHAQLQKVSALLHGQNRAG